MNSNVAMFTIIQITAKITTKYFVLDRQCSRFKRYFHGKITRDEAERLLKPSQDGLFLVHESTNFPGDYTLCVCFQSRVEHYRIIVRDNLKDRILGR